MSLASQYELPQTLANSPFAQLKPFKGLIDKIPTNQGIIEAEVVDSGVLDVLPATTDALSEKERNIKCIGTAKDILICLKNILL
ncbi:hypothetical protein CWI38_0840p0040 [Hamiltosporidium tvaerminnensis]|uniref:Uncharacterized protein n=1 Tax=Hamiltosporidium tvaerminnensis TaxID=1176355 RepID=A0A4Q9LUA9_9MICR|nr:hypothetical protein CWI38_0840p0040 [Hamiltosporidium tvaerminnensis]